MNGIHLAKRAFSQIEIQRERETQALIDQCRVFWARQDMVTEKELLFRLGHMSQEGFDKLLKAHPARAAHDSIENIATAFEVLRASRSEIIKIYGQFHGQAIHDAAGPDIAATVSAATKEIYTFACVSASLVQSYRHLASAVPETEPHIKGLVFEIFRTQPIREFIKGLRVSYNHNRLFKAVPGYVVKYTEPKEVESYLRFDRAHLLESHAWPAEARQFLLSAKELDVVEIINAYFKLAETLYNRFPFACGFHKSATFKDYTRLKAARKTVSLQMWLGLMLDRAKEDPYTYLPRYFDPQEVEYILCLPNHSKEQVDRAIELRDPLGLCDQGTRRALYRFFSVPTSDCA